MEKKNKSQQIINFTSSFHSNVTDVIYYFLTKCLYLIFLFIKNNIPSVLANKKKDALKIEINGRQDLSLFVAKSQIFKILYLRTIQMR